MDIKGKVAIVTGGGSGIGRATSLRLAGGGARVIVADLDLAGATATVQAIRDAGGTAEAIQTDVTRLEEIEALIARTLELYGALDILHNNAGIVVAAPKLVNADPAKMEAAMRVNFLAPMLLTRAALPALAQTHGVVINTASVSGLRPWPVDPIYSATKAGVVFFTQSMAPQLSEMGIRINAVCPGMVRTAMVGHVAVGLGLSEATMAKIDPRLMEPDEIVQAVLELIEDDNATGQARYVGRYDLPDEGKPLPTVV